MDKTIETKFFEAFKRGGVVNMCIDYMRYAYNLPTEKMMVRTDKKWDDFHKTLPKVILSQVETYDDLIDRYTDNSMIDEIKANLRSCLTDTDRERYLYSLLIPFGKYNGCGIANAYYPIQEIEELNNEITELEEAKKKDDKEQADVYQNAIEKRKKQKDWVEYVSYRFCELTCMCKEKAKWMKEGTIENCLAAFVHIVHWYANRLDALLLEYGIDLMKLQEECGIYLKYGRIWPDVVRYIGSKELAQKYINALPQEPQQEEVYNGQMTDAQNQNIEPQQVELKDLLPEKLRGNEVVAVFQRAINTRLIISSPNGLKWNDTKQLLAYFATKVSDKFSLISKLDKDGNKTTTWKPFETLFGEKDLKGAKQNWMRLNTKFEPTGFEKVDDLF